MEEIVLVKPCVKCGAQDRYVDGKCKPCVRQMAKLRAIAYTATPCTRACPGCGCTERTIEGKCKACVSARSRARNASHPKPRQDPAKKKEWNSAFKLANPDYNAKYKRARKLEDPEKVRREAREYYATLQTQPEKSEKRKESQKSWREDNKDKVSAQKLRWRLANPISRNECRKRYRESTSGRVAIRMYRGTREALENARAYSNAYRKLNRGKIRIWNQNRRSKLRSCGTLSADLAERLLILQRGYCPCCSEVLGGVYHLDHIVPIALGGVNEDWNIQLLTPRCNMQKGSMHPVDFMQRRGFLL